jgi:hypothetical protein
MVQFEGNIPAFPAGLSKALGQRLRSLVQVPAGAWVRKFRARHRDGPIVLNLLKMDQNPKIYKFTQHLPGGTEKTHWKTLTQDGRRWGLNNIALILSSKFLYQNNTSIPVAHSLLPLI